MSKTAFIIASCLAAALLLGVPAGYAQVKSHSPSPLIVQGHSPIVMLVTDPDGGQFGCASLPCTSTDSSGFVNTMDPSEYPSYDFTNNIITIESPLVGSWTVSYIGTGTGTFSITASSCYPDYSPSQTSYQAETETQSCTAPFTILGGSVTEGQTGSTTIIVNSDGTVTTSSIVTPEFPTGFLVVVPMLLVGIIALRALYTKRLPGRSRANP